MTIEALHLKQEEQTIDHLYTYYNEMVFVAKRIVYDYALAEDVVQEAFIKAYRSYHLLDDQTKKKAWLRTIVIRTAIDVYRKEKRNETQSIEVFQEFGYEYAKTDDMVLNRVIMGDFLEDVCQKVNELPSKLQEVMRLKCCFDWSDQRIADHLDLSLSAVKTRLHRARKQMQEKLALS